MYAKKSLGQHFLKSEKALSQIVAAGNIHADDLILEIGPGTGILTKGLLALAGKVVAVEKDRDLIAMLKETFAPEIARGRFDLIEGDILKFDPNTLELYKSNTYKLIANIPYYITGAIIEQFLSATKQPKQIVLLIQKEVAERIVARDKKESVLSIAVKAYGTPRIVSKVPAGAFTPAPKVDSAILSIENISRDFFAQCDERAFFKVLKFIFGKKRKQIRGSLGELLSNRAQAAAILDTIGIDPKTRPEDLVLDDWKRLALSIHATIYS
jgi:16S rRNA (adenine1518-N6/adenine1519-N6)-dimethyltransferase